MKLFSYDMSCIFCKIIKGEIPSYKIYEDENCIAILDINPRAKAHTLVIPKAHVERLDDANISIVSNLFVSVKNTIDLLKKKIKMEGYNIVVNCGKVAGQEINHLHVHILPRFSKDNIKFEYPPVIEEFKKNLENIYREIIK